MLNNSESIMGFIIEDSEVNEIINEVKRIYYVSNTYLNNIVGTYIEENKIKVLDDSIMYDDEIIGELQIIHLQTAISSYISKNNKNVNELQKIVNKGTEYVMDYISSKVKPEKYDLAKKYLYNELEEKLSEEFIIYFCAFSN